MKTRALNKYLNEDVVMEELLCGYISFSPDGKVLSLNKTMASWIGINFTDTNLPNFKNLMTKTSMLYYNLVVHPLINLKSAVTEISLSFSGSNGTFDALLNAESHKDEQGKLMLINATIQKVSDRKSHENKLLREMRYAREEKRKYEFLFNSAPNQIWTTDSKGKILAANQRVKDYFGNEVATSIQDSSGIFPEDEQKYQNLWRRALSNGNAFQGEIRFKGEKNELEWFMVTGEPYRNKNGRIEMWFWSATNIHKQKMLQLANQQEQKQSLSEVKEILAAHQERFVNIAMDQSHMIRKPLANILGLAKLMQDEDLCDEVKNLLNMLLVSVEELDMMIKKTAQTTIFK